MKTSEAEATISRAHLSDCEELYAFLYRVFRENNAYHPRFEDLYPDLYLRAEQAAACHHVVREEGRIVAAVGVYPLAVQFAGATLAIAGIGAVSTDPRCRGRGHMRVLLGHVRRFMRHEGYSISWLSGRRDRYARHGWERCGTALLHTLDSHSTGTVPSGWTFSRHEPDAAPAAVWPLRERQPVRALCTEESWRLHLRRPGIQLHVAQRADELAFGVWHAPSRSLHEWGGPAEGVAALAAHLTSGAGSLAVRVHPELDPEADALFRGMAVSIAVAELDALAVVSLERLAATASDLLAARWPKGRALHLAVTEAADTADELWLCEGRQTTAAPDATRVTLPAVEMAAFLFGPRRASSVARLSGEDRWVDAVFPLPFFLPAHFHV